jgi:L-lactate utilization protein LutC
VERRAFLDRLRPHYAGEEPQQDASARPDPPERRVLGARERIDLFIDRLRELGVEVQVVASRQDAQDAVERLVSERAWGSVACALGLRWPGISEKWTADARGAPFGLCEADWAVAETGTVVVKSSAEVRRGHSLLPPAVGFFVSERCIFPTVGDVLHELSAVEHALPSCISFISGPSNTADIASVHVVGVHGPREVLVWVIAEAAGGAAQDGSSGHDE